MKPRFSIISVCLFTLATVFILLAAIGAIRAYSPVPIGDMWNGYLGFYMNATGGDHSAWWAQHNEHRILLSRIFFWLDLKFFEGRGWFLILVNFLILLAGAFSIFMIWQRSAPPGKNRPRLAMGLLLMIWMLSWIQHDNITWGFQSQFFLAQLLPLLAFHLLDLAVRSPRHGQAFFVISCVCAVLALGSMANGVLALPLLTTMAVIVGRPRREIVALVLLSITGLWLYFHGYAAPGGHGSLSQAFRDDPGGLVAYLLAYLGGPFYYFMGKGKHGVLLAQIAGLLLIQGSALLAWHTLKAPRQRSQMLAMLFFLLYVGGTALATAGGRLIFGVEQGLTSRYMTPALMAWAAFFIAAVNCFRPALSPLLRGLRAIAVFALLLSMTRFQLKALESQDQLLYQRSLAALAIELRIPDQEQIAHVFPDARWALQIADGPANHNVSFFGLPPFADLFQRLGHHEAKPDSGQPACAGYLDELKPVASDSGFSKFRGWVFDASLKRQQSGLWIVQDAHGKVVGFALTGQERPDVAAAVDPGAGHAGYNGYMQQQAPGTSLTLSNPDTRCQLSIKLP